MRMTMTATRPRHAGAAARSVDSTLEERGSQVVLEDACEPPAKQRRAVARVLGLSDLMSRRPDLYGVYPPADVASEAVCWSA